MDLFRVRLDCIDHYQATPSQFDPQLKRNIKPSDIHKGPKVPVIRIFGSTETGQKVCAHIHGAFPYLYIEYEGSLDPDEVGSYIHRLHLSIDYALAVSYRRNAYDGNAKFVARITLVKAVPFYGFHVGYRFYLKIYMLNPMVMTRLADILRQGTVMKRVFQPYEAHLQFLLQWMADYNLYGCGYVDSSKATFRGPVPLYNEISSSMHLWHDRSIPDHLITNDVYLPRVSHCSLEVDICVQNILNRRDVKPRLLHHDFAQNLGPFAPDEKLVQSMAGLWKDETRRRKSKIPNATAGSSPFPAEVMFSMSADPRHSPNGGWMHEGEHREMVKRLIQEERNRGDPSKPTFNTFVKPKPFETSVKTSLESVEDLYPDNLRLAFQSVYEEQGHHNLHGHRGEREVDETLIVELANGQEEDEDDYDSDEDIMREIELSQKRKGDYIDEALPKSETDTMFGDEAYSNAASSDELQAVQLKEGKVHHNFVHSQTASVVADALASKSAQISHLASQIDSDHDSVHNHRGQDINPEWKRSQLEQEYPDAKRRKTSTMAQPSLQLSPTSLLGPRNEHIEQRTSLELRPPGAKLSSQDSLNFPVTKDSHDSSTMLKLSQRFGDIDTPKAKRHVSFLPNPASTTNNLVKTVSMSNSTTISSPIQKLGSSVQDRLLKGIKDSFGSSNDLLLLAHHQSPLSAYFVSTTMSSFNLPLILHQDAFYSREEDVPERPREWAGREFKLGSTSVPFLPDFDPSATSDATFGLGPVVLPDRIKDEEVYHHRRRECSLRAWTFTETPPSYAKVHIWARNEESKMNDKSKKLKRGAPSNTISKHRKGAKLSQIDGPTQRNSYGFKYTQNGKTIKIQREAQYMSVMSLEVHVNTRGGLCPIPKRMRFTDNNGTESSPSKSGIAVLSVDEENIAERISNQVPFEVHVETSELDLLVRMVEIVREYDPDILTGFEVHGGSWGYLIERARTKYDYDLCDEFSRMKNQSHGRFGKDNDKWGFDNTSTIRVTGRHMINIWRAMRAELSLLQYTLENVVFHLLHRRIPHYSWADLRNWYTNGKARDLSKVLAYYMSHVELDLEILEQNELISRTSEQARLLGVDFFSVFSRGSQFKVESLMFRIAKPENFILISPSRKQVGGQNALECLPLVMEPQSAFYSSPLLVLDFQSLYPSVMIAYNYCYSTYLGRVVNWRGTNKMGFTEYTREDRLLELLKDHINVAPNGIMYAKPNIRKSLLAKMLGEILETRVMVKSGMKIDKEDKALQRLLNNRQLALKLIANVTYGYTSASFSGRMPCSEIADSIVQTGRETLEKAIALIHSVKRWGAEVVYGDTDSLFVYLKGRSKDEAFDIGNEIAKTVTNMNPRPVKLKFEKVYHPCVLLAKKRYVGFKYESKSQIDPEFDAKGIETVRRDGTPAEQKIEEKALKILFRTADLSQVKSYFQEQCDRIMKGSVSIQDFCFAKEVKLGTYSNKGPPPAGALISTKKMLEDARTEPQYGERVPYVVITGAPGARLIDRCVAPEELLNSDHSELDAEYYISKNLIPPLERIFNLMGANVRSWYDETPKVQRVRRLEVNLDQGQLRELAINKKTLESYMKSSSCLVCKDKLETEGFLCPECQSNSPESMLSLQTRLNIEEKKFLDIQSICQGCSGLSPLEEVKCDSKDCPVFYTRTRQRARLKTERAFMVPAMQALSATIETEVDFTNLEW
ncbi:putative dna polymerase delta catalytic subunit protein [Botrytis fragariae]|uniref:DNA polymerase n=1 Tax=Botrytis fragariae TaxID=1964551 RepID=A0A8H6B3N8_9HELO|nr:putative dna polymerase delta catalytic subunit protein [Botrytis fragariae]KAF5878796.1 putative dna polymerase delta catalytic subunit protein [Botrytis fragariae]